MDLDTGLLRAFVATVEENHFGRAAVRLFVTQQALSKRIHRLEEILGARLLDRTNRRVELTRPASGSSRTPGAPSPPSTPPRPRSVSAPDRSGST